MESSEVTLHPLADSSPPGVWQAFLEIDRTVIAEPWSLANFIAPLPSKWELSFYAMRSGLICASVIASRKSERAHLHRISVSPAVRGQGVGSFLLQELARRARGLGLQQVTLKVHLTNQRAVRFYEANGFQIVGEAAPNLLMGKNL